MSLLALCIFVVVSFPAVAGVILVSATVPGIDGADIANLSPKGPDAGAFDPGGNEGHIWSNRPIQGQTFTTGSYMGGYTLSSVTLQNQQNNIADNSSPFTVRIGTISENTFTQVASEDSTNTISYDVNDFITFNFDTPVVLLPNTVYGFEWDASGNGFITWNNEDTNYPGGTGYSSGGGGVPDDSNLVFRSVDRVFHVDLEAVGMHSILLENPSFEDPGTEKQKNWENVPGWSSDSVASDSGVETGFTPTDGSWSAFLMASDPSVYQLINHAIVWGEVFELIVDARRTGGGSPSLEVKLYYNDSETRTILTTKTFSLSDAMAKYSLQFGANSVPESIGKKIGIEFDNISTDESWLGLDNVRLIAKSPPPPRFIRGDSNADYGIDISDAVKTVFDLFMNDGKPTCQDASDSNDDGELNITDVIYTLEFLFLAGDDIPPPGPDTCGFDPTEDGLDCQSYPVCCSPCAEEDFDFLHINAQGYPEYVHEKTGIIFVLLPGGTYEMGSPPDEVGRYPEEGPVHEVTLSPFLIAKYEVTQAQWKAAITGNTPGISDDPSHFEGDDLPVENVSWDDIQEFEEKTGLTLPTESQWEYACRARTPGPYAGSGVLDDLGWYRDNSGGKTHPVGQKMPNAFGLHDMHGNVWEWCKDVYDGKFYSKPEASGLDPIYTSGSGFRVFRGGCWGSNAGSCRSAYRSMHFSDLRDFDLGFRPSLRLSQ